MKGIKRILGLGMLFAASMMVGCTGQEAVQEETEKRIETREEETGYLAEAVEADYTFVYRDLLDEFYQLIAGSGDGSITIGGEGGVGEAVRSNEEDDNFAIIGYAIEDVSGDGIPELIIGDTGYGSTIYTMYTCVDNEPRCILESYYRSRYSWMGNQEFFYEGSGGAMYHIFAHYTLSADGRELICQQYSFSHETDETFSEIGFYQNTSGEMDPAVSTRFGSEEEFWALRDELSNQVQKMELIPFSRYKPD